MGVSSDPTIASRTFVGPYDVAAQWPAPIMVAAESGVTGSDTIRMIVEQVLLHGNQVHMQFNDFHFDYFHSQDHVNSDVTSTWNKLWYAPLPATTTLKAAAAGTPFLKDTALHMKDPSARGRARNVEPQEECVFQLPTPGQLVASTYHGIPHVSPEDITSLLRSGDKPVLAKSNKKQPAWQPSTFFVQILDLAQKLLNMDSLPFHISDVGGVDSLGSRKCFTNTAKPSEEQLRRLTIVVQHITDLLHGKMFSQHGKDPLEFTQEESREILAHLVQSKAVPEDSSCKQQDVVKLVMQSLTMMAGGVIMQCLLDVKDSYIDHQCVQAALKLLIESRDDAGGSPHFRQFRLPSIQYFRQRLNTRQIDRDKRASSWCEGAGDGTQPRPILAAPAGSDGITLLKAGHQKIVSWHSADKIAQDHDARCQEALNRIFDILNAAQPPAKDPQST